MSDAWIGVIGTVIGALIGAGIAAFIGLREQQREPKITGNG